MSAIASHSPLNIWETVIDRGLVPINQSIYLQLNPVGFDCISTETLQSHLAHHLLITPIQQFSFCDGDLTDSDIALTVISRLSSLHLTVTSIYRHVSADSCATGQQQHTEVATLSSTSSPIDSVDASLYVTIPRSGIGVSVSCSLIISSANETVT